MQSLVGVLACSTALLCGCGQGDDAPVSTRSADRAVLTFAPLAYHGGPPVSPASLALTARRVEERAATLGLRLDAGVASRTVVVTCGDCAPASVPTATGRFFFYDWEKNVRDGRCRAAPTDASVTGGQSAGQPGAGTQTYYEAVTRAAKNCQATDEPDDTTQGQWYGVDNTRKSVVCGPQTTEADAKESCQNAGKAAQQFVKVPQGYLIVQAESDDSSKASQALAADAFFIIKDDPGLLGRDIKNPEQNTDQNSGQPDVTFDFTDAGAKKWQNVTREIAQRGQAAVLPGVPAVNVANHFAIVLDNKLISVPYIDPQQNPDGIDGSNGSQISGSFTVGTAKRLAATLRSGALPLALHLIQQRHG
jgi:SecD/SecF fusion protein